MEIILFGLLALLLVFMFFNTRKRQKQMKAEQEEKATKTVPGAKVLLQGGLYGTIVSFDPENLDQPAQVEIAPGVVIEVHSQAILRIVEPTEATPAEDAAVEDAPAADAVADSELPDPNHVETPEETRARLERNERGDSEN
ncbi:MULTISPECIES: preprotein translocase subunit YajC [unclassified Microbacterium]|uniref:preprotein translocase subunit YajC n=1 Tax=unclassified Microbacterium TaxID=2609290 RepID=UPI0012FC7447|nr:preprotein translocase subunit YajC [Microbacterium sp. MAH-37]MVQ42927.1 preprotein translocase subunit YajC [Microbacterium sp. MAH-37]